MMIAKDINNIEKWSLKNLLKEYDEYLDLWGLYSCDCFGFYIDALKKEITNRDGWPIK